MAPKRPAYDLQYKLYPGNKLLNENCLLKNSGTSKYNRSCFKFKKKKERKRKLNKKEQDEIKSSWKVQTWTDTEHNKKAE